MRVLRLWFGVRAPVGRRAYALSGLGLMALKYAVDVLLVWHFTGTFWAPWDYVQPLLGMRLPQANGMPPRLLGVLALWTLPFLWVGVSMTVRRTLDAGHAPGWGLLFFVPVVNYLWLALLCVLPSSRPGESPVEAARPEEAAPFVETLMSAGVGVGIGLALVLFGVFVSGRYGAGLFLGVPFVMGFASAWHLNRGHVQRGISNAATVQLALLLTGGALLLFALEGVLCVLMAYPLAAVVAALGGLLGQAVAERPVPTASSLLALLALPLLMGVEALDARAPLREVVSSIEVDAPPEAVWPHVVGFTELPPPARFVFRSGVAYPQRARIEGSGVGAVRYCEFSTGAFVEPITAWEPPRRLAFEVRSQPAPMHEWSPYATVHAPHLVDGLRAERGEFRLVALPGGRTRLEGSTWYRLELFPQRYWTLWSDALIHAIHRRVLRHVAHLAEAG